jgi:hypothetical protein
MIAYILAGLQHPSAAYMTALTVNFFTMAFAFWVALDFIVIEQADIT